MAPLPPGFPAPTKPHLNPVGHHYKLFEASCVVHGTLRVFLDREDEATYRVGLQHEGTLWGAFDCRALARCTQCYLKNNPHKVAFGDA